MDRCMDGHTDDQRETIIPYYYRVAGYNSINLLSAEFADRVLLAKVGKQKKTNFIISSLLSCNPSLF